MTVVRPVVLSGGSGTRLWPVSTDSQPKQFHDLFGSGTLFAATLARAVDLPNAARPMIATGVEQVDLVEDALDGLAAVVIVEPGPRNTAPAILAAAAVAAPDEILVVMPSDHLIRDADALAVAMDKAIAAAAEGGIVTFGIVPDRPEPGYGWIKTGLEVGDGYRIDEFVEKPPIEAAEKMLGDPSYLWNSGMFIARADVIVDVATQVCPEVSTPVMASVPGSREGRVLLGPSFLDSPAIAFDRAVMERTSVGVVIPLSAGWSDVGSWAAIWEVSEKDEHGNVLRGRAFAVDTRDSLVLARSSDVAVVGLEGIVVVETESGVVVAPRERVQELKGIVRRLNDDST